ncbi:hypothetical protein ACFLYA_02475 [Candidatus Dependentiae bacterium]
MNKIKKLLVFSFLFFAYNCSHPMEFKKLDEKRVSSKIENMFHEFKNRGSYTDIIVVSDKQIHVYCGRSGLRPLIEQKLIGLVQAVVSKVGLGSVFKKVKKSVEKLTQKDANLFEINQKAIFKELEKYVGKSVVRKVEKYVLSDPSFILDFLLYAVQYNEIVPKEYNFTKIRFFHDFHKSVAFRKKPLLSRWYYVTEKDIGDFILENKPKMIMIRVGNLNGAVWQMVKEVTPFIYAKKDTHFKVIKVEDPKDLRMLLQFPKKFERNKKNIEKEVYRLIQKFDDLRNSFIDFYRDASLFREHKGKFNYLTFNETENKIGETKKEESGVGKWIEAAGQQLSALKTEWLIKSPQTEIEKQGLSQDAAKLIKYKYFIDKLNQRDSKIDERLIEYKKKLTTLHNRGDCEIKKVLKETVVVEEYYFSDLGLEIKDLKEKTAKLEQEKQVIQELLIIFKAKKNLLEGNKEVSNEIINVDPKSLQNDYKSFNKELNKEIRALLELRELMQGYEIIKKPKLKTENFN